MDYTRNTWVNGASPAINATNLNNIEQGIVNVTNPDYDTTSDLSGVRSSVLSGNTNGALTQIVSGESAVNLLGDTGGFYVDSDGDGVADGWTSNGTSESLSYGIQSFTANNQFDNLLNTLPQTPSGNDKIYLAGYINSDSTSVKLTINDGVSETSDNHSGSGDFERLSLIRTLAGSPTTLIAIVYDDRASSWTEVQAKQFIMINLTEKYGSGSEPSLADCDLIFAKHFDNIGHATINQKIAGTNGEFELKEPYVIPKDPAGTSSEIVTLDGQNFVRMKHKLFVLDGDLNWTNFQSNTFTYRVQLDDFPSENDLVTGGSVGRGINNDLILDVNFDFNDENHIFLYSTGDTCYIYLDKALIDAMPSGGSLAGFKEYLNANSIHAFFRINSSIDIPIKHLGSIEDGTITNNSTILPSAITYTYPTSEAGERESAQVAQNQITNTKNNVIQEQSINRVSGQVEFIQPIYEQGTRIVRQGGLTQQIIEYDKTTTITRVNGQVAKVTEVPR